MPSAPRLVAALCLAFLAFVVSGQVIPLFEEGKYFGNFTHYNVALGFLAGWVVMGKRVGKGTTAAINNGIAGVAVGLFWCLFLHSCNEMVDLAMRNRYKGPFEAIIAIFEIGVEYARVIAVPGILVTLLVGAVASGLLTEAAARRWR